MPDTPATTPCAPACPAPLPVTRYGACFGSGDWIEGRLFGPCPDHPGQYMGIGAHISSSVGWSQHDVHRFHHDKIGDDASFVWLGHCANNDEFYAAMPAVMCMKSEHQTADALPTGGAEQ